MVAIGGKTKTRKASQPQFVVQISESINEYMLIKSHEDGHMVLNWVGDPNAATKFDSRYSAKLRVREMADVPETRCFRELEKA